MAAPHGCVRVRRQEGTVTFQVEGWGTVRHSLGLRRCAEQHLADGASALEVDLHECEYLDSTFLGTLVALRRSAQRAGACRFQLVAPSPACQKLLHQMALDRLFTITCEAAADAGLWTEVAAEADDVRAFQRNVVEAHQELAGLEGPAGTAFRAVASSLAQALEDDKST